MPEGLRVFLDRNSLAQIIRHPDIPQKIGAVPVGIAVGDDPSSLLGPPTKNRYRVRFYKDFWETFHTPISGRRFVILTPVEERGYVIHDSRRRSGR
jgi:hypothetical protein